MKSYNGRIPACGVFCGGCPIYTEKKVPAKEQNRMVLAVKNVKHSIYVAWKKGITHCFQCSDFPCTKFKSIIIRESTTNLPTMTKNQE